MLKLVVKSAMNKAETLLNNYNFSKTQGIKILESANNPQSEWHKLEKCSDGLQTAFDKLVASVEADSFFVDIITRGFDDVKDATEPAVFFEAQTA